MTTSDRELLRIETETDLRSVRAVRRYRDRQRLRRPPKRSDAVWLGLTGLTGVAGWIVTGPHPVWFVALAIVAIYGVGEWRERSRDRTTLEQIDATARHRAVVFREGGLTLIDGSAERDVPWRTLDEVRRFEDAYVLFFHDDIDPLYVPYETLGATTRSGRLESLLAAHDRLVQDA